MNPISYPPMNHPLRRGYSSCAVGLFAAGITAFVAATTMIAQTAPGSIPAPRDEVVQLSVFEVSATKPNRYQAAEATSGGRVRTDIFNSPQTINVVTEELIKDVGANRILDALKYIPGVTESTIPNGLDRVTVRGFQIDGRTVDGFYSISQANLDPATISRIEVVKGPNAILSPAGSPGGTLNAVSKKPLFTQQTSLTVRAGLFDDSGIELDSTGPAGGPDAKAAYRVVGAYRNADNYYDGTETVSHLFAPSVTYRFSRDTQLTLQGEFSNWRTINYLGIPLDPASGSTNTAVLLSGVPEKIALYNSDVYRKDELQEIRALFTSRLTDNLSTRVAARYSEWNQDTTQLTFSPQGGNQGGARDPLTGLWTPGLVYGPGPTFTPSPAPVQSRIFTQGGSDQIMHEKFLNFQNDWVYQRTFDKLESTTAAGFAYSKNLPKGNSDLTIEPISNSPFNIDAVVLQNATKAGTLSARQRNTAHNSQVYVNQIISAFEGRVNLSAGVSHVAF